MKTKHIVMFVVFLLLGMLLANMLKPICGCNVVEGQNGDDTQVEGGPVENTAGE